MVSKPRPVYVSAVHSTINVLVLASIPYAWAQTQPLSVSTKGKVKVSKTLSVPSQMYLLLPSWTPVWKPSVSRRVRLFTPSQATMRSASGSCEGPLTS